MRIHVVGTLHALGGMQGADFRENKSWKESEDAARSAVGEAQCAVNLDPGEASFNLLCRAVANHQLQHASASSVRAATL